ncbi:Uncharacterised protein [Mycobacteroides abscessus subsp. abscessus]|uniref:hypothetical protein n=1 Tax=Mycobacteroides abscessus TaxID=36809 RepID=UPI000927569A|nr:hypothetical protein [Mycobacteroides abscessus]SHX66452.1 Uncharacterised protein [Mycobacteroides abscessus subsp. abscessus]SIC60165.1 Uncharacterised protein [Mycobacteroides abscessus subsp. abscessus]SKK20982.1 Uncharacterised protein [Mycobacteroides abscessus subsp. abscessus]SKP50386.1 Uncharacterised protein [Mycobacteroides abscessus subsp. abscessus]
MTDHIMKAELRIAQMQERQLAAAEASPVAKSALWEARTRAVLRVAARLNATVDQLHQLRILMGEKWSVEAERAGELGEAAYAWAVDASCGDSKDEWEVQSIAWLVEELWPDIIVECEESARRALT